MESMPSQAGFVIADCTTMDTLLASATWTSAAVDATMFASISVQVKADQASATDGLKLQFSVDGSNWDDEDTYTVSANSGKTFTAGVSAKWFRVQYVNGGTDQGAFRLQTLGHNSAPKPSSHNIKRDLSGDNDAELVISVPVNLTYGTPAQATVSSTAGNLVSSTTGYRKVTIKVAVGADTGIYVNANGTATSSHFLLGPGEWRTYETKQAISAIRAGASNVTVYVEEATL